LVLHRPGCVAAISGDKKTPGISRRREKPKAGCKQGGGNAGKKFSTLILPLARQSSGRAGTSMRVKKQVFWLRGLYIGRFAGSIRLVTAAQPSGIRTRFPIIHMTVEVWHFFTSNHNMLWFSFQRTNNRLRFRGLKVKTKLFVKQAGNGSFLIVNDLQNIISFRSA
jgi:hypothetical protein